MRKLLLFSFLVTSMVFLTVCNGNAQISGDSLVWRTAMSGYDTIPAPVGGIYDMGSISYTDHITYLSLRVTGPVDTSKVPAIYGSSTIGYMVFDTITHKWKLNTIGTPSFLVDTTYILMTFKDTSSNPNYLLLKLRFMTIDTMPPVADSLKATLLQSGAHTIVSPAAGVYNFGGLNESDHLTALTIKIDDYDIDTSSVMTTGSFSMQFHYNGSHWVASGFPAPLPVGNDSIIAVFKDNSNNSIQVKIKFTIIDNIPPVGGKFVWYTINTGRDSLNAPSSNAYNLGNICNIDHIVSLNLVLIESNPDTNKVPLILTNDTIGWMNYNPIDSIWKCTDISAFPVFPAGANIITAKFSDKASPAHVLTLTFKFTIGNHIPHVNLGKDSTICSANSYTLDAGAGMDKYRWEINDTNMISDTLETFVAKYSTLNGLGVHAIYITVTKVGCTGKDTVNITIDQTPTITVSPATISVCSGIAITLTASGADSYTWSNNSQYTFPGDTAVTIPVLPAGGGISVVATGTVNGCSSTAYSNVTVQAVPNIGLGPNISITKENNIYLGLTTGYSYLWSNGSTGSNIYIIGENLNYGDTAIWVKATNPSNGCIVIDTIVIDVIRGTGINSESDRNYLKIYPNPSGGIVNFEIEKLNNENISVGIFDILGNKVYGKNFGDSFSNLECIDLTKNLKGVYFVKVYVNNKVMVQKLILY